MGGYDFPGSNSGIDLHALSGWIPDRLPVKEADDAALTHLWKSLHKGDVLMSIATGQIAADEAKRTGLSQCHAYALLDIRIVGLGYHPVAPAVGYTSISPSITIVNCVPTIAQRTATLEDKKPLEQKEMEGKVFTR